MKKFLKKFFLKLVSAIVSLILIFFGSYIAFRVLDFPEARNGIDEFAVAIWDDCVSICEVVSDYISGNYPKFDGLKLREIDDFEIAEYIDFTVPYDWNVMTTTLKDSQKATVVYNDNAMAIMYIQDISINGDVKVLKWYRDELIKSMKEEYPNYTFNTGYVLKNTIALVEVVSDFKQSKMNLAVVRAKDKTIIIEYMYDLDSKKVSEAYFNKIINEILDSI